MPTQKQLFTARTILAGLLLSLYGCGGGNTNTVAQQNTDTLSLEIADTNYIPKNLIQSPVVRNVDAANPPVKIDLTRPDSRYTTFDLADHFKKATIKVLTFPEDSGSFVYNKDIAIKYDKGMQSFQEQSDAYYSNGYYIVSDYSNGILQYDSTGNYIGTIYKSNLSGLKYNKRYQFWEINLDRWHYAKPITSIGKYTAYIAVDSLRNGKIGIWDPAQGKEIKEQAIKPGHPLLLPSMNDTVRFLYRKTAFDKKAEKPMLYFFNNKGDTLNKVQDYIALEKVLPQSYASSADNIIYYKYDNYLHFRQPYSDTLFRILSPSELRPVYLLDFGKQKPTMDIGYYGDKSNSFMLQQWDETDDLVFIIYSKNYDCRNTRKDKSITFYYAVYDKKSGQLGYLDMKGNYPDTALLPNTLPGSLPLNAEQFNITGDGKISARYFKEDLQNMIQSPVFNTLPTGQQELVKQLEQELGPDKIAVMTIE